MMTIHQSQRHRYFYLHSRRHHYLLSRANILLIFGLLLCNELILSSSLSYPLWQRRSFVALLTSSSASLSSDDLLKSLQSPTDARPQIPIPDSVTKQDPVIEGLISVSKSQPLRPNPSDTCFITVQDIETNTILAGAAIPISRITFPFRFILKLDNALPNQRNTFETALRDMDLIVETKICAENNNDNNNSLVLLPTCQPIIQAKGLAKLLRLGDSTIRAPVTLVLE